MKAKKHPLNLILFLIELGAARFKYDICLIIFRIEMNIKQLSG